MKPLWILVFAGFLAHSGFAQEATAAEEAPEGFAPLDATDLSLEEFKWVARPLIVFADSPADPRFQEQIDLLLSRPEELVDRDVVVLTDTNPSARSQPRQELRPRGFSIVLLAKDGTVELRKPFPWDVREITRVIDKMPLRQQELRDRGTLR